MSEAMVAGSATDPGKDAHGMGQLPIPGLFDGFTALDAATRRVRFAGVTGGKGPPVLLLHGYPETHAAWHDVAPALAERHTVVVPDLPGYGRSLLTDAGAWDKREVAAEAACGQGVAGGQPAEVGAAHRCHVSPGGVDSLLS